MESVGRGPMGMVFRSASTAMSSLRLPADAASSGSLSALGQDMTTQDRNQRRKIAKEEKEKSSPSHEQRETTVTRFAKPATTTKKKKNRQDDGWQRRRVAGKSAAERQRLAVNGLGVGVSKQAGLALGGLGPASGGEEAHGVSGLRGVSLLACSPQLMRRVYPREGWALMDKGSCVRGAKRTKSCLVLAGFMIWRARRRKRIAPIISIRRQTFVFLQKSVEFWSLKLKIGCEFQLRNLWPVHFLLVSEQSWVLTN